MQKKFDRCKIGKTSNWKQRKYYLKRQYGNFKLIKYFRYDCEKKLHQKFKKYNIKDKTLGVEWFKYSKIKSKI